MLRRLVLGALFAAQMLGQQPRPAAPPAPSNFQISGVVVDAAGNQPISGVRVAIAPVSQRDAFTTVVTGEDGRFSFPGLAPGKYTLTAQHRGYVTQSFNQHGQFSSSIAVGPELDSSHLVFAMIVEGAISGSVIDDQGEAVRDAHVMLFQSAADDGLLRTSQRASAMTDDEGHYHFSHLRAGKYFVAVSAQPWYAQRPLSHIKVTDASGSVTDYAGGVYDSVLKNAQRVEVEEATPSPLDVAYPITFYGGATDASAATPILLGKGDKVSADISLQAVPAVHWRVNTPSEQQQQSFVLLEQRVFDGAPIQIPVTASIARPGVVELSGFPPGRFTVNRRSATGEMQEQQELEVDGNGAVEKGSPSVAVPLGTSVSFEPPAALSGQIGLLLREKTSNKILRETINGKGEIEFKEGIQRGTYEISVQGGRDIYLRSVQATGARITGRILEIKGAAPVKLNLTIAAGRGDVSGIALRGDNPTPGVMVVLVPADPAHNQLLFRRDQSDSDGSFNIADVVPGRYTLLAIADGWDLEWANPAVLERFMPQGEPLTVEARGKYSVKVKVQ